METVRHTVRHRGIYHETNSTVGQPCETNTGTHTEIYNDTETNVAYRNIGTFKQQQIQTQYIAQKTNKHITVYSAQACTGMCRLKFPYVQISQL